MSYNLDKFNLSSFNVKGSKLVLIKASGEENVTASINTIANTNLLAIGYERVEATMTGSPTRFIKKSTGTETVSEMIGNAQPGVFVSAFYNETITGSAQALADISFAPHGVETITESIIRSAHLSLEISGSETVDEEAHGGAMVYVAGEGYELVSASASLIVLETKTCYLTTTLKPGDVLIIDASSYTVLKNGENAIDIQSGDWIDELNRNTTDIQITAASGVANLSASIVYTERYL